MNYIILGKSKKRGVFGDDSKDLKVYFELGWEVVGSRIDFIKLLKTKDLTNTIIVTSDDRKFFYSKLFDRVITYEEFENNLKPQDTVDDWTNKPYSNDFAFLSFNTFIDKNNKYIRYDEDYEEIFNGFDLSQSTIEKPEKYVVIGLRARGEYQRKNFLNNEQFFVNLINNIKKDITENIFVVGFGTEDFCEKNGVIYVDRLDDFVNLIKDKKRCIGQVTQSTGTAVLSIICSEVPIHLIDHLGVADLNGSNAVLGGKCIHFCKEYIHHYRQMTTNVSQDIIKDLKTRK